MDYDSAPPGQDLSHPDALIRVASAVHRFRSPQMGSKKLSYRGAFKSASSNHEKTRELMGKADGTRESVLDAMAGTRSDSTTQLRDIPISYESVSNAMQDYIPRVNRVLLSCKVQPDAARLDERLVFEWTSGIEKGILPENARRGDLAKPRKVQSEALMYELVMSVATEGIALIGMACDDSTNGDFPSSSRKFKQAAGVFETISQDLVPKWMARGSSVDAKELPSEATAGVAEGLKLLSLACAQQMAVATVLIKPGTPNYALLAKLCLGIAEQLEDAVGTFRTKASESMPRLDESLFTLVEFQSILQRALYLYFLARSAYEEADYGLGIALLREASTQIRTRDKHNPKGLPSTDKRSGLATLDADVTTVRSHFATVLAAWEKDNSTIYFDKVPNPVPESAKLAHGMAMMKAMTYETLEGDVEPVPLTLPTSGSGGGGGSGASARPPQPSAFQAPPPPPPPAMAQHPPLHYPREPQPYASVPPPPPPGGGGGASAPPPYWSIPPPPPEPTHYHQHQQQQHRPAVERSDSDLARELQARLNAGEDL